MPQLRLTLLVGSYAQADALGRGAMTERVRGWREYLPRYFPLPHPSWRTEVWEKRNPWFQADVLPGLRAAVGRVLEGFRSWFAVLDGCRARLGTAAKELESLFWPS